MTTHADEREAAATYTESMIALYKASGTEYPARWTRSVSKDRRIAAALRAAEADGRKTAKIGGTFYAV